MTRVRPIIGSKEWDGRAASRALERREYIVLDGSKTQATADQPALGYVLRMFWMAFGNVALIFAGLSIATSERIGIPDVVYVALTLALLLARWVDIAKLNGMTIYALPATRAHLHRYTLAVTGLSLTGWVIAHYASTLS